MPARNHVLPKVTGAFLIAATFWGSLPPAAVADPVQIAEANESKGLKKTKRKRSWSAHGLASWTQRQDGTAFAPLPGARSDGTAFARLPKGAERTPAEVAVATARAQIGKPYRYGASGPSAFDCSGLMRFSWAAAGVALPRTSGSQFASLRRVPIDELKPGDLVYRPGHVGMYIGKGRMVHSPHSGTRVQISPLGRTAGAVRPE
jgi:cell wall-associated NlpC family hydrolase